MPLKIEAILSNTKDNVNNPVFPSDFWVIVSGVTPGSRVSGAVRNLSSNLLNYGSVTAPEGYAIGSAASRALVPITFYYQGQNIAWNLSYNGANGTTAGLVITDTTTNENTVVSGPLFVTTVPSVWTISQDYAKNCNITCTSLGSAGSPPFFISLNRDGTTFGADNKGIPSVFNVEVSSPTGLSIYNSNLTAPANGSFPFIQVPSATITTTGKHTVQIKTRYGYPDGLGTSRIEKDQTIFKYQIYSTVLTAPASSTSPSGLYSWLNSNYWYLTDLQLNVASRAVTSRKGSISIRPNDTVQFAVLFNNGTAGIDPIASDVRIAVRAAVNNGPYVLWSAATVTTLSVGGDTYYSITVTASDEDLLSGQASRFISGSNSDQTLAAQIQWTTSRGTFSSETFTINTPNEVVRDSEI
jgi:hypothetical protein